ncbi:hypothetical protein EDD21DRAFT_429606 [Dissophora ornata]|nr:hypothetical protein EDD21DRAFT_429606 [Dissophora ornata]
MMFEQVLPVVCTVRVIYAYMAREEDDLTLNKGDIIKVHDNDGGWWKGTLVPDGIYGNFPSNFVELMNESDDSLDSPLSPSKPKGHQRQHSRQSIVDGTKFTKRKPVNTLLVKNPAASTTSIPFPGPLSASSASLGASSRKNPQAMFGDSGLCTSIPGAFPTSTPTSEAQAETTEIANKTVYNSRYVAEQRRNSTNSALLNPSCPSTALSPAHAASPRQVSNRYSMPNLVGDAQQQPDQQDPYQAHVAINAGEEPQYVQNSYSEDPQFFQPGMMPRSSAECCSQQFGPGQYEALSGIHTSQQIPYYVAGAPGSGHNNSGSQNITSTPLQHSAYHQNPSTHRHSIASMGASALQQHPHQQMMYSIAHSELSSENLSRHNRSQSALDQPKSSSSQGRGHGRSLSQVYLRPDYDHQPQQAQDQQKQHQARPVSMRRKSIDLRGPSPSIVIPKLWARPQSAVTYGTDRSSPINSSPTMSDASTPVHQGLPTSPPASSSAGTGTPTSTDTSMSGTSVFGGRGYGRKNSTARMPPNAFMTVSTSTARKFSADSSSSTDSEAVMYSARSSTEDEQLEDLKSLGMYTAKKPKTTLMRAFKQILNPKKVADEDELRNKSEHFAWIEMQKSLKRVNSPEPGKEKPFFSSTSTAEGASESPQDLDPFEVHRKCQVMRDTPAVQGGVGGVGNNTLDFGPNTFVQVDKVARNVNQRGPHMTPQLLSQKYLTRPYSKSPLSKLRVLFVWVSENIRLEGGPTRDVSGGRYKLGPAGDHMAALSAMANGDCNTDNVAAGESPNLRSPPPASVFMTGVEEYARSFLQEDTPELAKDVLANRICKTGEGFANLFAEMALAAGIEDVGVVKGYIKGPMDVFSKDMPPPNHAWNVIRIDGTYRFIDCCLASPFHPAHYPNRPQVASSFYFLASPTDLALSHFPTFLTYQYISPLIPPQIFLQLPFVRPAFFDFGLSLPDFKRHTKLDIKDDEPIEVVLRIDGCGTFPAGSMNGMMGGHGAVASNTGGGGVGPFSGLFGGDCLGRGCGEGIELRAEVEVMTAEGKVIRKRALAQVMIWNPYRQLQAQQQQQQQQPQQGHSQPSPLGPGSSPLNVVSIGPSTGASISASSSRPHLSHYCTGIRIAKIKAVLPTETVLGTGGVRKGVLHIYAGRKVEHVQHPVARRRDSGHGRLR